MTYKLPCEKKPYGSPRRVVKRTPFGRILKTSYIANTDEMELTHATRGVKRMSRDRYFREVART